jgi:hypothetical protein
VGTPAQAAAGRQGECLGEAVVVRTFRLVAVDGQPGDPGMGRFEQLLDQGHGLGPGLGSFQAHAQRGRGVAVRFGRGEP